MKYLEDGTKVRVSRGIGASESIIPRPDILKIRTTPRPTVGIVHLNHPLYVVYSFECLQYVFGHYSTCVIFCSLFVFMQLVTADIEVSQC